MRKKKVEAVPNEVETIVADAEVEIAKVKNFLETVLNMAALCECTVEAQADGDTLVMNIIGDETNSVIGYHGETLDALQYLCGLMLDGRTSNFKRVTLNTGGYREKREKTLKRLASNLELKVKRTGRAVNLEPMNPYERRIIHTALQNSQYVTTDSEGQGNARHVVVAPKKQNNVLNSPNAPRKTLNFVYHSEKKRR